MRSRRILSALQGLYPPNHEAGFKHHLVKPIDLNKLDLLIQGDATALPRESDSLAADRVA